MADFVYGTAEQAIVEFTDWGPLTEEQARLVDSYKTAVSGSDEYYTAYSAECAPAQSVNRQWVAQFLGGLECLFVDTSTDPYYLSTWIGEEGCTFVRVGDDVDYPFAIFKAFRGFVLVTGARGSTCPLCAEDRWWGLAVYWAHTLGSLLENACDARMRLLVHGHFWLVGE